MGRAPAALRRRSHLDERHADESGQVHRRQVENLPHQLHRSGAGRPGERQAKRDAPVEVLAGILLQELLMALQAAPRSELGLEYATIERPRDQHRGRALGVTIASRAPQPLAPDVILDHMTLPRNAQIRRKKWPESEVRSSSCKIVAPDPVRISRGGPAYLMEAEIQAPDDRRPAAGLPSAMVRVGRRADRDQKVRMEGGE
jgi:hypothetical protein